MPSPCSLFRVVALLAGVLGAGACASAGPGTAYPNDDLGAAAPDLPVVDGRAPDVAAPAADLSGIDLSGRDLAPAEDLAAPLDAAPGADLSVRGDLAGLVDLRAVDLRLADLAAAPDLSPPRDMRAPPDLALACVPQQKPCDTVCQDCPVGQRCSAQQGVPICKNVANNPAQVDATCSGDNCGAGAVCVLESDVPFRIPALSLCRKFCRVDADCTNGGRCVYELVDGNGMPSGLRICSQKVTNCDPVAQTGCAPGSFCYPVTPDGQMGCHAQGANAGSPCDSDWNCAPGNACIDAGGLPVCRKLCHAGQNAECAGIGLQICFPMNGFAGGKYGRCN